MEIWIRSQDKTSSVECKTIDVLNRFNEFHIVANYIDKVFQMPQDDEVKA